MNKIIITAPFGATFKNLFLNNDLLSELLTTYAEVHIITPISSENVKKIIDFNNFPSVFIHYIPEEFNFFQILFAQASSFSFNKFIKSDTLEIKLKDGFFLVYQKIIWYACFILNKFISWERLFIFFDYLKFYFSKSDKVKRLILKINPNVVFVTAPSFRFDFSIIKESLDLGLPIVGMVHSWDNLSSKGSISDCFSRVLVWNEFQKNEIKKFYKSYKENDVLAMGIPQMDYYLKNKDKLDRKKLEEYLNIDSNTKIISYTTGANISNESAIVEKIIKEVSKFNFSWHMLIRLHPRVDTKNYESFKKYKNITVETVNKNNFFVNDGMGFQKEDMIHYGNILKNSNVVINIASTVFVEAIIMGTSVIGVAFDADEKEKAYYKSTRRYYDFNHASYLSKLKGVHVAYSPEELTKKIILCLEKKQTISETAHRLAFSLDGNSGKRIASVLNKYCYKN